MEKYGFVYLWYDKFRSMYYLGCHWGTKEDGYICSSDRMRKAYRRRPHDFKRRILKTNIDRCDLLEEEFKWLSLIGDNELGTKYYNFRKHHYGHWSFDPEASLSIKEKISKAYKPRPPNSGNWVKGQAPWNKGKKIGPQPKETIEKRSISNSKRRTPYKGATEYSSIKNNLYKDYVPSRIGKGGKTKQIKIGDITYNSCTDASKKLDIHISTISRWIKEGKAISI